MTAGHYFASILLLGFQKDFNMCLMSKEQKEEQKSEQGMTSKHYINT